MITKKEIKEILEKVNEKTFQVDMSDWDTFSLPAIMVDILYERRRNQNEIRKETRRKK